MRVGELHAGATRMFVLIRRPADAELLPGFLPKRGLQIRLRKGLQVQAHVKITLIALIECQQLYERLRCC